MGTLLVEVSLWKIHLGRIGRARAGAPPHHETIHLGAQHTHAITDGYEISQRRLKAVAVEALMVTSHQFRRIAVAAFVLGLALAPVLNPLLP